jgi:hypothetical protein
MKKNLILLPLLLSCLTGCVDDPLAGATRNYANSNQPRNIRRSTPELQQESHSAEVIEDSSNTNVSVSINVKRTVNKKSSFNISQKIETILADNRIIAGGYNDSVGVYVISVVKIDQPNLTNDELNELALTRGKKEIAAFIGQEIKAHDRVENTTTQINDQEETKSFYSSVMEVNVSQLLNGVTLYKVWKENNETIAVCYLTGKTADMSARLKAQIAQLPPDTVGASGIASIEKGNIQVAKEKALRMALRNAVEQVLGTVLAGNTQVQDNEKIRSRIFSQSRGFVETYRIVTENSSNDYYRIEVIAKIAKNKLLDSYSSYLKTMGDPEFFIRTNNKELYLTFLKFFEGLGLKLTNNLNSAVYIIDAIGDFKNVKHPVENLYGTQLSLWIRIYDAKSGQELLSQKNNPRRAVSFVSSGERQKDIAVEKAFKQIRNPLHKSVDKMISQMVSNGRIIVIKIAGYQPNYKTSIEGICNSLGYVIGNDTVTYKINGNNNTVVINANYIGQMVDLESFLRKRIEKDFGNRIIVPITISIEKNELKMQYR